MFKIVLQFLRRDSQSEIVEKEELEFELVQFLCGKTSDLLWHVRMCIARFAESDLASLVERTCNSTWKVKAHLGIPRVRVKHVREELAGHRNSSDDQPMDVVRINDQWRGGRICRFCFFHFSHRFVIIIMVPFSLGGHSLFFLNCLTKFAHPIEINEQAEENLVCGRAVLKDAEKV